MKIQSNGMGMQSVAMYLMSCMGELPRFDKSVFADPGAEHVDTYNYLEYLNEWNHKNNGIELIKDDSKNLYKDIINKWNNGRVASIPAFTKNGGLLFRQCTYEYKIMIVNKYLSKGDLLFIGISLDEMHRIFKPRTNVEYHYPFCNIIVTKKGFRKGNYKTMTRGQIKKWLLKNDFDIPVKSSCVFCPFHDNKTWKDLKKTDPEGWIIACDIDKAIRKKKGLNNDLYLHRSCVPLEKAYLQEDQAEINFDCYGFCDI